MNHGGWGGAVHKPRSVEHGGVRLMIMVRTPNTSTAPKPLHEVPMLKPDTKNQIARRVVKRVAVQMAAAFPEATHSVDGTLGVFVLPTNGEAVRFKDHVQRLAIEPYTEQTIDAKIVSGELMIKATLTDPNIKTQQYAIMLGTCNCGRTNILFPSPTWRAAADLLANCYASGVRLHHREHQGPPDRVRISHGELNRRWRHQNDADAVRGETRGG